MGDAKTITTRCLCGSVEMRVAAVTDSVGACHCSICRKWGGGPLLAVNCGGDIQFSGHKHIGVYSSSAWAQRGFCKHCGTHLYCRLKLGVYLVPAGLLDNDVNLQFTQQIFIENKPGYYNFSNDTAKLTQTEVIAAFSAKPPPHKA